MKLSQTRLMRINVHLPAPSLNYCNRCGNNVDCCNHFLSPLSINFNKFTPWLNPTFLPGMPFRTTINHSKRTFWLSTVNLDLPISPYMGMWYPKESTLKIASRSTLARGGAGACRQTSKHFDHESPLQIVVIILPALFPSSFCRKQSLFWANLLAVRVSKKLARREIFLQIVC